MLDPQHLSLLGSIKALIALGRIPLASEVPIWTAFGCILAARIFPQTGHNINWWIIFQCAFTTWATNISINYGNEYFDWDLDRPGQIEAIDRSMRTGDQAAGKVGSGTGKESNRNDKIMGNTTRIIHDGTFPPYTALILGAAWQAAVVGLILYSRSREHSPYRGVALQIGIVSSVLSQMYVGPPIRLHYHGLGELVSALLLNPVAVLFGLTGYYTAATGKTVVFSDLLSTSLSGFSLGSISTLLAALYCLEQARVFIMHIQDIAADIEGGKITFVVRVGHRVSSWLYILFNLASLGLFRQYTKLALEDLPHNVYVSWVRGISIILAFSIPVMVITARSLFAQIPPARLAKASHGLIPALPLTTLPLLVSLQLLLSPIILSLSALLHW